MDSRAQQTAALLRARAEAGHRAGELRAARLRGKLGEARSLLVGRYGVTRVALFGSLAAGTPHAASDVDLWVEGLPAARHFDAAAELDTLFGVSVDLVRAEDAPASLRERVEREGREL